MHSRPVLVGVVVLALLGLLDLVSPWVMPAPPAAPAFADPMSVAFGVLTLVALGVWWSSASRAAMWVVVVLRGISGLFCIPAFLDAPTVVFRVALVVAFVATVAGIVLVAPTLASPARDRVAA